MQVSRVAALLEKVGVEITGEWHGMDEPQFILSACWRDIAPGILSTTRFTGMQIAYGKKYVVYDVDRNQLFRLVYFGVLILFSKL